MQRITIEIADDGRASVTAEMDGGEPEMMEFDTAEAALEAVEGMLAPEAAEAEMPEGGGDMAAMWDEEAARRPPQMGLMA